MKMGCLKVSNEAICLNVLIPLKQGHVLPGTGMALQ